MKLDTAGAIKSQQTEVQPVAYALTTHNLTLIAGNDTFCQWFDLATLTNVSLLNLLPELTAVQATLHTLHQAQVSYQTNVIHHPEDRPSRHLALHIEPALTDNNHLSVILLDTTHLNRRQQQKTDTENMLVDASLDWDNLAGFDNALFLLNKASQVLIATLNVADILQRLLEVANQLIGAEGSSVWLWDEQKRGHLICRAVDDANKKPILNYRLNPGQGVVGWVAQNGQSTIVRQVRQDSRFTHDVDAATGYETNSVLAVPMWLRGEILGVLEIVNKVAGHFDVADQIMAETLAASASIALDNARLVEKLQQQKLDLQHRNEDLDAFAHTVAHDLQNPLTSILGFSDLLVREGHRLNGETQIEILQMLHKSVEKMRAIVHELLLLATVSKSNVTMVPLDMQQITQAALDRVAHMLLDREAEIILPESWPLALGHPPWVEELWENYLSNAIKYGGDPLHIELGGIVEPNDTVRFWVKDNGHGVRLEDQARLFEPFTKLGDWTASSGHGLGLSIVRRITEKLNGSVRVESKLGEGSVFSFTLPAV